MSGRPVEASMLIRRPPAEVFAAFVNPMTLRKFWLSDASGPLAPGGFAPSVPVALLPPIFTADSYRQVFVAAAPNSLGFGIADPNGYAAFAFANPHFGFFTGTTLLLQAAGLVGSAFQISNPVLMQLK